MINDMKSLVSLLVVFTIVKLSSCQSCSNLDADVIIIGAGMSGISAAKRLQESGIDNIIVLEANAQVGGRIRSGEVGGVKISLGAGFVHGIDPAAPQLHPLIQLAGKCGGLEGFYVNYDSLTLYDSQGGMDFTGERSVRFDDYNTAVAATEMLAANLQQNGGCTTTSFRDGLSQNGWTPATSEDNWVDWLNFDSSFGTTPDNSSLCEYVGLFRMNTDFTSPGTEGEDYFITDQEGYVKLVECMADGFTEDGPSRLHFNSTVTEINWGSPDCVCVTANETGNVSTYCARYGISTLSIGVLQADGLVEFVPPLPESKKQVLHKFDMGAYLNVYVELSDVFWDPTQVIGHIHDDRGYYPMFLNLNLIFPERPKLLIAILSGEYVERASTQPPSQTRMEIEQILTTLYPGENFTVTNVIIPDWFTNPLFMGSYSHAPLGVAPEDRNDLSSPINNLYFSGEATHGMYWATVHGAYFAGIETANAITGNENFAMSVQMSSLMIILCMLYTLMELA